MKNKREDLIVNIDKALVELKEKKIKIRKKLQNVLIFEKRYGKIKSTIKTGVIFY